MEKKENKPTAKKVTDDKHIGKKTIIGLIEKVCVYGNNNTCDKTVLARIDTGATSSAIDTNLAAEVQPGPIVKTIIVKSTHGSTLRPVVEITIKLDGQKIKGKFTIADRTNMKYSMLIGQNILKKYGFLIDPNKKMPEL